MGDDALIDLLSRFLAGNIDIDAFERDYLHAYKQSPIEDPGLQPYLGRAFLAVEGYDRQVTPETETVHNFSFDTMVRDLRSVWADLESYRAQQIQARGNDRSRVLFVDAPELLGPSGVVRLARIGPTSTKDGLIEVVASGLSFPEPYGRNWDAFEEMLNRLEWLPEVSIILTHDAVPKLSDFDLRTYLSILRHASANWASEGSRAFVAVFPSSGRDVVDLMSG